MNFLNPYAYIGAAIFLATLGGTFYYQSSQIHHYHQLFNQEHDNFTKERQMVVEMLIKQAEQTKTTEGNVTKVVNVPGPVKTIVKEIHDAPVPVDCSTPPLSEEAKNAF